MINSEKIFYELTHPQKRIWYIDKLNSKSQLHNIGGCLNINEKINIDKMKQTINIIIKNNEGLRLRIIEVEGQPVQCVYDYIEENIDFYDFSNYEKSYEEYEKWSHKLFREKFELENKQLYYFAIYKINKNEYGILLNIHHIISDGWSISLIEKQICEIYNKLMKCEEIYFEEHFSYIDYIKEEEKYFISKRFIKNKIFWNEKFRNMPEEFLYYSNSSLEGRRLSFNINIDLSKKIKEFLKEKKCSLNTFFVSTFVILLNKITSKRDLVIGTPVFNRLGEKQRNMIGMFTSTVPFKFYLDTELNIESLIKQVNRELKICFLNQKYPYNLLIKDLQISKAGYDSLFKMCVNCYNANYVNEINGNKVEANEYYCGNQSYSLQLTVKEWVENNITLNFDYKTVEYTEQEIIAMYEGIVNIINQVIINKTISINDINLLNKENINYKLYKLNSTSRFYPQKTVCELFEEQTLKTPDRIALEFKEQKITYKELNEKSNQLANYLIERHIGNKEIIGIMQTHSIELITCILGVLKSGASYLPIDSSYPIERIKYMLEDSKCSILFSNVKNKIEFKGEIIDINSFNFNSYSKENIIKLYDINDLAYIIYTSGSTGMPKGVMIEHRGLTNYVCWAKEMYLKDKNEVMPLYSSISFDLTITSIFTPLVSGNKIVIYDIDDSEFVLFKILKENKSTVIKLTPSHLTLLKNVNVINSNLKRFIVGGEDLKVSLAKEIYNTFGSNIEIYNEYGPTETVVGCMIYKYNGEKDRGVSVPIGYPANNVQIYILDNTLNIVPTCIVGEIYVSGDGVARGYLNRDQITYERFIENPFVKGQRMYKTGDTARYLENGAIEYVGRIDNQVKIRGYRIELGEIERYLLENEFIIDVVVTFKENSLGNKSLNAYIVSKIKITDVELKNWLLKFLPKYMIPTNFVFIDKLPLTLNGKVNHELLPDPIITRKEIIKCKTEVDETIVAIIEEILGVQNISMNDNYYQLGGDSIKAIQISSKLKNIGLDVKVKDILAYDSIEEIVASVEEGQDVKVISQEQSQGTIERTPIIEWFLNRDFVNQDTYNQYVILEYNGVLDINKAKFAVNKLIEHHDGVRINYDKKNNKLYYNNEHLDELCFLNYIDLSQCPYDKQCENVERLIDEANISFDIEKSLLFNVTMFNRSNDRQVLLFTAHHLIVDGISWRIILDDFITIINQLNNDAMVNLPMKTNSFKEWADIMQEYSKKDFSEEKAHWLSIINKDAIYPLDFYEEKDIVKTSNVLSKELDKSTLNELIKRTKEIYNIEFNEVLIIALALTISNLTNKNDVVIELERHGREVLNNYIDVSRTVGWFTSIYPVYFKIDHEELDYNIKSVKEQLRSIPNKGFNYSVIKFLKKDLKESENKYIRFNYLGDFDNIIDKKKLDLTNIEFGLNSDKENSLTALIDIVAVVVNAKLKVSVMYSNAKFKEDTIRNFIDIYINTLELILDHCINKHFKEFTPSDFDSVEISQEDLDTLFD